MCRVCPDAPRLAGPPSATSRLVARPYGASHEPGGIRSLSLRFARRPLLPPGAPSSPEGRPVAAGSPASHSDANVAWPDRTAVTVPAPVQGLSGRRAMKLEAVCNTCRRRFLLTEILPPPEGTSGRCPFCGAHFGRHYVAALPDLV